MSTTDRPPLSRRLARGTLTPDAIAAAALALLDHEGVDALSMPRLGRVLGASSTAVYRHYQGRDQIVLAVGDLLVGEALAGFEPAEEWVDTLRDLALRFWATCERHPAAASMTYVRTTRGPHEMRAVEAILGAVRAGGWEGREAVLHYRGFASLVLGLAGAGATFLALPAGERAGDESAWLQVYGRPDGGDFPELAAMAPHLTGELSPAEVYEHQVDLYLQSMASRAPSR